MSAPATTSQTPQAGQELCLSVLTIQVQTGDFTETPSAANAYLHVNGLEKFLAVCNLEKNENNTNCREGSFIVKYDEYSSQTTRIILNQYHFSSLADLEIAKSLANNALEFISMNTEKYIWTGDYNNMQRKYNLLQPGIALDEYIEDDWNEIKDLFIKSD
jgi:hypothetical protein